MVDTLALGASGSNPVEVQVLFSALRKQWILKNCVRCIKNTPIYFGDRFGMRYGDDTTPE